MLNDTEIEMPSLLTLGQRITFYEQYGRALDEQKDTISKMVDGDDKELEIVNYNYEKMLRVFAFIADISLETVKESEFIDVIATVYYSRLAELFDDISIEEPKTEFEFNGGQWLLSEPELKNGGLMSFGEFIDAKMLVKDMIEAEKSKWEIVKYLAAIYLRKKDEKYKEEFLYESSDRLKVMEELPMDIAGHVDFFLSGIMNFSILTLKSSERVVSKDLVKMSNNIMIYTDGSISLNRSQRHMCSIYRAVVKTLLIRPETRN